MPTNILHIDSSAQTDRSASRQISQAIVSRLMANVHSPQVVRRDTNERPSFIDNEWIGASFTPESERSGAMVEALKTSAVMVTELAQADHIVIGSPLYNFAIPATLKTWIDHVARPGLTFQPTDDGFEGLLKGKRAYLAIVSGSTQIEGPMDHATPYLKQMLGFLGITDVLVFPASNVIVNDRETVLKGTLEQVDKAFAGALA